MFNVFAVLPKVFSSWRAIQACIEGGATKAELTAAVGEIRSLLEAIPPLRGVLAIFDVLVNVLDKVAPFLLENEEQMHELDVDVATIEQAQNVVGLYKAVMTEVKDSGQFKDELLQLSDVDKMI